MRGAFPPDVALRVSEVLMNEGINVFEMMMNSEAPIEAMQAVKAEYGADACVGMGTVLDVESADGGSRRRRRLRGVTRFFSPMWCGPSWSAAS